MEKKIISHKLLTALREFALIQQSDRFQEIQDENFKQLVIDNANGYYHLITLVATKQAVIK